VFFPFIGGDDLISMLTQFAAFGLNETVQVAATLLDESFLPALPETLREGILASESYFTVVDNEVNKAWLARYRAKFGQDVLITNVSELTYDAIWMWREAIEACGRVGQTDADYDAMIDALYGITFDKAPQGPGLSLLPGTNHLRNHSFIARSRADGTFVIEQEFGLVDPEIGQCRTS
jgi:urea transport system substrate-binding protein